MCEVCATDPGDELRPERIHALVEILKHSNKKYRYNRGSTLTVKTEEGRIIVGTKFENRSTI